MNRTHQRGIIHGALLRSKLSSLIRSQKGGLLRLLYPLHRLQLKITRPLTVGVRLILLREGQPGGVECVLLVRHTYHDGWLLPGGGVDRGEDLETAARREAAEELGAVLGLLMLRGVYTNFFESKSDHVVVFACREFTLPVGKTNAGVGEIERAEFFPLDALPPDLFAGHRRRLEELLAGQPPGFGRW